MADEKKNPPKVFYPIVEKMLKVNFEYLQRININPYDRTKIPEIIVKIRQYWSSSKVNNKDMKEVKKYLQRKVRDCTKRTTSWFTAAVANAFVVYLMLRIYKND
jgi:hypothetical protein